MFEFSRRGDRGRTWSAAALAAGLVAGGLAAAPAAAAELESSIEWVNQPTIMVMSDGQTYAKVDYSASHAIEGDFKIHADPKTGTILDLVGRMMLKPVFQNGSEGEAKLLLGPRYFEHYNTLPRPRSDTRTWHFSIDATDYSRVVVDACNANADMLRGTGMTTAQIHGADRHLELAVGVRADAEINAFFRNRDLSATAFGPQRVNVTCRHLPPDQVESVELSAQGQRSLNGACSLKLSGSLRTNRPNTEVRFRYADSHDRKSDVKSVTTGANRRATFSHDFPMPKGHYNGLVRIEGAGPEFDSNWKSYSVDCPDLNAEHTAPQGRFLASLDVTGLTEGIFDGYVCPLEVQTVSRLADVAEEMDVRLILRMESLDFPVLTPDVHANGFHIRKGLTATMPYDAKVNWSAAQHTPGQAPSQRVKLRYFVKQGEEVLKTLEKMVELKCRQPEVKVSLDVLPEKEKVVNSFICPETVEVRGRIMTADPVEVAYSVLLDPSFGPSAVDNKQVKLVAGQHWAYQLADDLNWNGSPSIGGQPPAMKVKARVQVRRQDDNALLVMEDKEIDVQCRARPTSAVGGGAPGLGGKAVGAPMNIVGPNGRISRMAAGQARIQLSGGSDDAVYALTFYRKVVGGMTKVSGAGIPQQMTGRELRFNARKLTGSRYWRLKVCPAGPEEHHCKMADFELAWE